MLVSTTVHDEVFRHLGQSQRLSLSSCKHLHKVTDEELIAFIRKVIEVLEAPDPRYKIKAVRRRTHDCSSFPICLCPLKTETLDLANCRNLRGEALHFAVKHMPGLRTLLISNQVKFDATQYFKHETLTEHTLIMKGRLSYLGVQNCNMLDSAGVKNLVTRLQGKYIKDLDLYGCQEVCDSIATTIAFCESLETLKLCGSAKITSFGVGLIAYLCRHTLRGLSLRYCCSVNLPELLFATSSELIDIAGSEDDAMALPCNFSGGSHDRALYISALCSALVLMARLNDSTALALSRRYKESFINLDRKWRRTAARRNLGKPDERMFAKIVHFDLSHVGRADMRLEGCLSTLAWLNDGSLRTLDISGLTTVSHHDITVLSCATKTTLKTLGTCCPELPTEQSSCFTFVCLSKVRELDLSNTRYFDGENAGVAMVMLTSLRSLTLDNTNVDDSVVATVMVKSQNLLRLSVRNCRRVTSKRLCGAKAVNTNLHLLELDCRNVTLDVPLARVQKFHNSLLTLNGRYTELGRQRMTAHRTQYQWRTGAKVSKSRKRKRSEVEDGAASNAKSSCNCCTLQFTGFSHSPNTEQEMFICKTCSIDFGRFLCSACARTCHRGHDVVYIGTGRGFCDCVVQGQCKLIGREDQESEIKGKVESLLQGDEVVGS